MSLPGSCLETGEKNYDESDETSFINLMGERKKKGERRKREKERQKTKIEEFFRVFFASIFFSSKFVSLIISERSLRISSFLQADPAKSGATQGRDD